MAIVNNNTRLDIANKMSLGISSTTNDKNWFEELYAWSPQLHGSDIFAETIPYAANATEADTNVTNNPTILEKLTDYQMDELPASNGQAYGVFETPGDINSERLKNFVSPQKYGMGYMLTLKDNNGTTIPLTDGAWQFDHHNGVLRFDDAHTPSAMGYALPLKLTAYRYIGATLDGAGAGCNAQEETLNITSYGQTTFTLSNSPSTAGALFLNGQFYAEGVGYSVSGTTLTWLEPDGTKLDPDDELVYKYCIPSGGSSSGGGVSFDHVVVVDPNATEVTGKVYKTWAAADAWVQTQTPSSTNRYAILISGPNSENITLRNYVALVGMNSGHLQGSLSPVNGNNGDPSSVLVFGLIVDNIQSSNANNTIFFKNCTINGGTVTAGDYVAFENCNLMGGTFSGVTNLLIFRSMVYGGEYTTPLIEWSYISDETGHTATFHGFTSMHSYFDYSTGTVYDNNSDYTLVHSTAEFPLDIHGTVGAFYTFINNTWAVQSGGQLILKNATYGSSGSITNNGGTITNVGEYYDNTNSNLTSTNAQNAIDELDSRFYPITNITIDPTQTTNPKSGIFNSLSDFFSHISNKRLLSNTTVTLVEGGHEIPSYFNISHPDSRAITIKGNGYILHDFSSIEIISYTSSSRQLEIWINFSDSNASSDYAVGDVVAMTKFSCPYDNEGIVSLGSYEVLEIDNANNRIRCSGTRVKPVPTGTLSYTGTLAKNRSFINQNTITSIWVLRTGISFENITFKASTTNSPSRLLWINETGFVEAAANKPSVNIIFKGLIILHSRYSGSYGTGATELIRMTGATIEYDKLSYTDDKVGFILTGASTFGILAEFSNIYLVEAIASGNGYTAFELRGCKFSAVRALYIVGNETGVNATYNSSGRLRSVFILHNVTDGFSVNKLSSFDISTGQYISYNGGDGVRASKGGRLTVSGIYIQHNTAYGVRAEYGGCYVRLDGSTVSSNGSGNYNITPNAVDGDGDVISV